MLAGLELVQCLGSGSHGQAWLARGEGCQVVVKQVRGATFDGCPLSLVLSRACRLQVPLAGLSTAEREQAMGEAVVLRSCNHLNITQCFGCWVEVRTPAGHLPAPRAWTPIFAPAAPSPVPSTRP